MFIYQFSIKMDKGFIYFILAILIIKCSWAVTNENYDNEMTIKYQAYANLKQQSQDQTLYKLMATVVTNLLKHQDEGFQQEAYQCLQHAKSKQTYAQCVAPVIMRHRAMVKARNVEDPVMSENGRKKRAVIKRRRKLILKIGSTSKTTDNSTFEIRNETIRGKYKVRRITKAKTHSKERTKIIQPSVSHSLSIDDSSIVVKNTKPDNQLLVSRKAKVVKIKGRKRMKPNQTAKSTLGSKRIPNSHSALQNIKNSSSKSQSISNLNSTLKSNLNSNSSSASSFTLAPAPEFEYQLPTEKPYIQNVGEFLVDMVQNVKSEFGSWFKLPDIDLLLTTGNVSYDTKSFRQLNESTKHLLKPRLNEVYNAIDGLMNSKLIMLKDDPDFSQDHQVIQSEGTGQDDMVNFLSPRFMPMAKKDDRPGILSPDVLSLYEGGDNNLVSIPDLMGNFSRQVKQPWLDFFSEITGAADVIRGMKSTEFKKILALSRIDAGNGITLPAKSVIDVAEHTVGSVYQMLNAHQVASLGSKGYSYFNRSQLDYVYGDRKSNLRFDVDQFLGLTDDQRDYMIMEELLSLAFPSNRRTKRQALPAILAPYIGGTVGIVYLLAPQILSPSVFSYVILGPLVLSPYILSPYVFGPFILAPEVLTPFILSPYVLSPTILSPVVLGPAILNPIVLSPYILSPFVLSPSILSPTVLNPNILSPGVLGPAILSPVVLGPNILSPSVLNPAILSPSVLSPSILSPGVLNPSILSPGVLNHAVLSPSVKSPSILSPCFLCKRRLKRSLFLEWLLNGFKDEPF